MHRCTQMTPLYNTTSWMCIVACYSIRQRDLSKDLIWTSCPCQTHFSGPSLGGGQPHGTFTSLAHGRASHAAESCSLEEKHLQVKH